MALRGRELAVCLAAMRAKERIYHAGDPEPHDEAVLLLESGHVCQRVGTRWVVGNLRLEWSELLLGDMVAVGVDLPAHPDPLAVHPQALITRPAEAGPAAGTTGAVA